VKRRLVGRFIGFQAIDVLCVVDVELEFEHGKIILGGCAPHFDRSSPAIALGSSFMILQPGFINIVAPMIDARSTLKSWPKMPTVSQSNDGKDGFGFKFLTFFRYENPWNWSWLLKWRWCAQSRRLEVVPFVGRSEMGSSRNIHSR